MAKVPSGGRVDPEARKFIGDLTKRRNRIEVSGPALLRLWPAQDLDRGRASVQTEIIGRGLFSSSSQQGSCSLGPDSNIWLAAESWMTLQES